MGKADSSRVGVRYHKETSWGEAVPNPCVMQELRTTGSPFKYTKQTKVSAEIRNDRNVPDVSQVGITTEGTINGVLSRVTYDDLIAAALCSDWVVLNLSALSLTVAATAKTVVRSAGDWNTDLVKVGVFIQLGGAGLSAGNKKAYRVAAVTNATTLTLEDPNGTLVDEGPIAACTLKARYVRNGITKSSFLFEEEFTDITKFRQFFGMIPNTMSIGVKTQDEVSVSFGLMGKNAQKSDATVKTGSTAATTTAVLGAADCGELDADGALVTEGITEIAINVNNNDYHQPQLGTKLSGGVGLGQFTVNGTIQLYLETMDTFDKVLSHADVRYTVHLSDPVTGKYFIITLPAVKVTGDPQAGGNNTPVMQPVTFDAKYDAATACMIQVDTIEAA